jgi:hypothetical protein
MARQAEVKLKVTQEGVEQVKQDLADLNKSARSMFSSLPKDMQKDLKKGWEEVGAATQQAFLGVFKSFSSAVASAGYTSFEGAMQAANRYRNEISRIAVSTGRSFADTGTQVNATAKALGEMPASVVAYGRAVRQMGVTWDDAMGSVGAFKDRALQLDRPIAAMADQAARLQQSFGLRSQEQVSAYFGLMDSQAAKVGITVGRMARQWEAFDGRFGHMSSRGAGLYSGMSAAFAASSTNPEVAQGAQAFGMNTLSQGVRLVEMRMRRRGELGKGEYLTDDKGEVDPQKYLRAMQFMQKDMLRFYGGSKRRAIEVQAGESLEARRDIGAFFSTDLSKVKDLSELSPTQRQALDRYMGMDAGKREQAEAEKHIKDVQAGMGMLPGQDAAVAAGGGAAGLAMAQAAGIFSTATDKFGDAVLKFVTGGYAAASAGGSGGAAGAGVGGAAVASSPGFLRNVVAPLTLSLAAGSLARSDMEGVEQERIKLMQDRDFAAKAVKDSAKFEARFPRLSKWLGVSAADRAREAGIDPSTVQGQGQSPGQRPDMRAQAEENAKALRGGQPVPVALFMPGAAPEGQGSGIG